jgi:hypothetical protein
MALFATNPRTRLPIGRGMQCGLLSCCLLVLLVLYGPPLRVEDDTNAPPFRVGFSRRLFTDVNENDAKTASIRAWAQTVARERGIHMDPVAQLYDGIAEETFLREARRLCSAVDPTRGVEPATGSTSFGDAQR